MKKLYALLFIFLFLSFSAQDLQKVANEIKDEGIILYRSEMASWYGTDIFIANYPQRENISGFFFSSTKEYRNASFFLKKIK